MSTDSRNLISSYWGWTTDLIKAHHQSKAFPCSALMSVKNGDFNLSCLIRSANSFGIGKVFYYGKKKIDMRGTVGTHNYLDVIYLKDIEEIKKLKSEYCFVGLENNIPNTIPLHKSNLPKNSLFVVGEECGGICPEIVMLTDMFIEIPSFGTVRSLNAAAAATTIFYEYVRQQLRIL